MVGSVTVVDYPVDSDDRYDDSRDDVNERDFSDNRSKSHAPQTLFDNQRMFGKYKVTVDWILGLPTVNEINGIEILISDTTKKGSHGSGGGCGGSDHGSKGSHGGSMKGMGGHEGGCPHFQMVKRMIPQIELLENGVSQADRNMKITLSIGNHKLTMPIAADENLPGRYTAIFVPTVSGKYGVEVHGTIHGSPVEMMIEMDKVYDKNKVAKFT